MTIDELLAELTNIKSIHGGNTRVLSENGPVTSVDFVTEDSEYPAYVLVGWN